MDEASTLRILVAVDFSDASAQAIDLARERFGAAALLLLHAVDPALAARVATMTGLDATELQQRAWNRADAQLEETLARLRQEGCAAEGALREGDLGDSLVAEAGRLGAHLVVLGVERTAGVDALPWLLAKALRLPVLVCPPRNGAG